MGDFQAITIGGKTYYKFSENNKYYHKYTIIQNDNLTTICAKYGYNSYSKTMDIYNDPANAEFRQRFPDANKIDYINSVPFYIPVQETEKQTINTYIINLVTLTIIVNPPSDDPFTKYKLTEEVEVHYFLKYSPDYAHNKDFDELPTSGKFNYNNEIDLNHEIKISKQSYSLLSGIYIWIEPYGHGAIIDPGESDPRASGRFFFPITIRTREIKIEIIEGVMMFIIREAAINESDPVISEIQKLLTNAKSAPTKEEREKYQKDAEYKWGHKVHKRGDVLQDIYFKGGGEWDYKEDIRPVWGAKLRLGNRSTVFYYDIWANLHYGYIGKLCGFTKNVLIEGANKAQRHDTGKYDPIDDVMTQEGYDIQSFDEPTILSILERNTNDWSYSYRDEIWNNKSEAKAYIDREFGKRGIALPECYKDY